MSDLENLGAELRQMALDAGISAADLDGPPRCFAGCGTVVPKGNVTCAACTARRIDAEHADALRRAWGTVPASLRWVSLAGPHISDWVKDASALRKAREAASQRDWRPLIVLTGEPGAGKTTLACALMHSWMLPGARRSATMAAKAAARRARFVAANRIVADRAETRLGEHVVSLDLARSASMLVLDEVGRGTDTHGVIFSLLHERHGGNRATIMTTPYPDAASLTEATKDGGLARRVFDDALVIHVGKVA